MIEICVIWFGRIGFGALVTNWTVMSSIFFTSAIVSSELRWSEDGICARLNENTTSSAVNFVPSWNATPARSLNSQVVGLTVFHDSASAGSSFMSRFR